MRRVVLLLLVLCACGATPRVATTHATTAPSSSAAASAVAGGAAVVSKEVDGDTIHVLINGVDERVRFIGMDTPETHGHGGLVECFGKEGADRTAALIPVGTAVRLVRDVEPRDKYGRLLAYVYRAKDGLFINLELAKEGYADVFTYPPNVAHAPEFVAAVADAREHNRGLWSACGSADVPIDPKHSQ